LRTPSNSFDKVFLRIGDITICITSEDPELKLGVEEAAKKFVIDDANPDVRIRTAWRELSEETYGEKIFDSATFWQLYDLNGSYLFRFILPGRGSPTYKIASFNPDFSLGEVRLHRLFFKPGTPVAPLDSSLDQLLVTNWLAKGNGALVHACGIVDSQGRGHLFLGQSGAGKSTMARLWQDQPGIEVLSDDRVILRKKEGSFWMYGTPWHGDARSASPGCAQLKGVYFLEKGRENELIPLKGADTVGRLFTCSFPLFYSSEAIEFILNFFGELVNTLPCYELKFRPDQRVVEFMNRLDEKD